jgi:hypothetical protein
MARFTQPFTDAKAIENALDPTYFSKSWNFSSCSGVDLRLITSQKFFSVTASSLILTTSPFPDYCMYQFVMLVINSF